MVVGRCFSHFMLLVSSAFAQDVIAVCIHHRILEVAPGLAAGLLY